MDIAVSYLEGFPRGFIEEFERDVQAVGLELRVEPREQTIFAGLEWLLPTAVVAYIGKSYFDGFLKEAGKEHYQVLKSALKRLRRRTQGEKLVQVATPGKVRERQPYSLVFSVMAEAGPQQRFKLLVQSDLSEEQYDEAIDEFMLFLSRFQSGEISQEDMSMLREASVIGGTLLLSVNFNIGRLESVDPLPRGAPNSSLQATGPKRAGG